ncbi:MAG: hypothetical protein M1825_004644 [Sarcosagium campestre]|nr:MAG: hypothetical protein M1825_004644 [Sarcosagium campestre]
MHASSIILTAISATAALALPHTPVQLVPRCGTTVYPSLVTYIDSSKPSTSFGSLSKVSANSKPGGPYRVAEVQFSVPAGAGGACALNYAFPSSATVTVTGTKRPAQLQVLKSSGAFKASDTWNAHPAPGSSYGVVSPAPGAGPATVNSEACASRLSYFVQTFEQWQLGAGDAPNLGVEFTQSKTGPANGLYLTYGC